MDETKTETNTNSTHTSHHVGRIQPRRSSRSTLSNSPTTTKEDRNGVLSEPTSGTATTTTTDYTNDNDNESNTTLLSATTTNHHSRVTRSLSVDSNSNEESSTNINTNGKRRRHTNNYNKTSNKKRSTVATISPSPSIASPSSSSPSSASVSVKSPPRGTINDDNERETRNTTQRLTKEAKDARKAERGIIVKKKLDELETLEQLVKDQSHVQYQKLLKEIQDKRNQKLGVAQGRFALMETHFRNGFLAQKKSAFDKFYFDKLALRRTMMNQVQQKINRIEQEYFYSQQNTKSALDDQHLNEWTPPDRPAMINILLFTYTNHYL
ncbi:hypothetical protein BC941DRAFT_417003 [Chlamydoabsidia padenii]|nr:hypothetical protein BC941DRAFT_417003 [Chlamydoabsidia padenii]